MLNTLIYSLLFRTKSSLFVNIINITLMFFGVIYRFYDFSDFKVTGPLIFNLIMVIIAQIIFILLVHAILIIEDKQKR